MGGKQVDREWAEQVVQLKEDLRAQSPIAVVRQVSGLGSHIMMVNLVNANLPLLSLLFKVEAIHPLRAPGSDIMMVNLAIVIQTMPNNQEI